MYYSADSTPQTFSEKAVPAAGRHYGRRGFWWWLPLGPLVLILGLIGAWGWRVSPIQIYHPETLGVASAEATPQPTVSRTFGDLLKEQPSYDGWLAGVDNGGNILIVQPENGSLNRLVTVSSPWYGPISKMVWSPDRRKLAYLTLAPDDAAALAKDAAGFAASHKLSGVPTPQSFPYGQVTILDITTKQAHQTTLQVRNTPKPLVWLDGTSLAAVGQTLVKYNLNDDSTVTLSGAGNTNSNEQLQSPLAWDSGSQTLYFTKVKQTDDGQSVRLAASLNLSNNQVTELQTLKDGQFDDVTTSQGIDLALSPDGSRLAELGEQGLSYVTVADQGVHVLPYDDSRAWMQQSILSDMVWLSPDKIGFTSLAEDGTMAWGVWDIPGNQVETIGRGNVAGSWDLKSGRLAVIGADHAAVGIVTPDWDDATKSQWKALPLNWTSVSW